MARSCALLQVYLAILFAHIALFPTFCSAVPEAGAPGPAVVLWFASSEFPLSDAYSALAEAFVGAAGKPSRLMPQPPLEVGTTLDQLSSIVSNVLTGDDLVKGPGRVFLAAHGTSCAALLAPVSTAVEQAAASAQAPAKPGSLEVTIGGIKIHGTVLAGKFGLVGAIAWHVCSWLVWRC